MASFDADDDLYQRLDFRLLMTGPVALYWDRHVLNDACETLAGLGYRLVTLDAAPWTSEAAMHDAFAAGLDFPYYYGRNLNALNDCLSDVATASYGLMPDDAGLVLILLGVDAFFRRDPSLAHAVLDIVASQSRGALLIGNRLLCLAQSEDPNLVIPLVGASRVEWNPAEWLDARRSSPRTTGEADRVVPSEDPGRVTIVPSRYGGAYEPGLWLAFPCDPDALPDDWNAGDTFASSFYAEHEHEIGAGDTPTAAWINLQQIFAPRRTEPGR